MTVKVDLSGFDDAEQRFRMLAVFLQNADPRSRICEE